MFYWSVWWRRNSVLSSLGTSCFERLEWIWEIFYFSPLKAIRVFYSAAWDCFWQLQLSTSSYDDWIKDKRKDTDSQLKIGSIVFIIFCFFLLSFILVILNQFTAFISNIVLMQTFRGSMLARLLACLLACSLACCL